jgi:N-acetyl-beta-hexosaminidase
MQLLGDVPFLHIGADEVFNLATCRNCQFFQEEAGTNALYAKFVRRVIKHISKKYPATQIMAWDDMFRSWTYQDMQKFRVKGKQIV